MAVFVFFRIVVSVISLEQKYKKKSKGEFSVCWMVHDQHGVKKSHPNTLVCNIERGIADQQKNQHLGWPSSCVREVLK